MLFFQHLEGKMEIFKELKKNPIFKDFNDGQLSAILDCFSVEIKEFDKNQSIFQQNQPIEKIALILRGEANVEHIDIFDNQSIILNLKAGDFFGLEETYAERSIFLNSLIACEKSVVAFFDSNKFVFPCQNNCKHHQALLKKIINYISSRNLMLIDKIKHLSQKGIKEKVLSYLQSQSKMAQSPYFDIPFNKTELANYLSVERSALSTVLSRLKKEGVIDFEKKRYHIKQIK